MARLTPPDRLEKLLAVAADAFVRHGFQRTQMDDIAAGLGVSKGTVYRSVDSKESLLAAVIGYADAPATLPPQGPIEGVGLDQVSSTLRDELAAGIARLELSTAVNRVDPPTTAETIGEEVELIALDLYDMMATHRVRVMVLDRCAAEVPELGGDWYESGRYALVDLWVRYLTQRSAHIGSTVDADVLARTIVELVTLWAVKMPWDPAPRTYPQEMASHCAAMIRNLVQGEH